MFNKTTTLQQPKREMKGGLVKKESNSGGLRPAPSGSSSSGSSEGSGGSGGSKGSGGSVLGLDKLAERKREAKREEERRGLSEFKVPDSISGKRKRDEKGEEPRFHSRDHKQKHFRRSREETPSRGDGVNEDALDRIQNKEVSRRHPQNDHYRTNSRRTSHSWDVPSPRREGSSSWEDVTPTRNRWDSRSSSSSSSSSKPTPSGSHEVYDTPRNFTPSWKNHWEGGDRDGRRGDRGDSRRDTGRRDTGRRETGRRETTTGRQEYRNSKEYEEDFERQFYNNDGAVEGDPTKAFIGSREKWKERETEMEKRQMERLSAKRQAMNQDNKLWEENRLMLSGVASKRTVELEFDDDTEARVHLLVHDIKPPFLDGRIVFTKQQEAVAVVKDPTSDIATLAKKGSQVLRELREKKDRMKSRKKYWELSGSRVGKAMDKDKYGKEEETEQSVPRPKEGEDGDNVDYRASAGFSGHLEKMSSDAVSHFARTKTMREQREFLPIFKARRYLMNVIRENQIIVIVGQTGSGEFFFFFFFFFSIYIYVSISVRVHFFFFRYFFFFFVTFFFFFFF